MSVSVCREKERGGERRREEEERRMRNEKRPAQGGEQRQNTPDCLDSLCCLLLLHTHTLCFSLYCFLSPFAEVPRSSA
jgi:hypothetical protein